MVAYVKIAAGSACLFEIERKLANGTTEDGSKCLEEEALRGLILTPPKDRPPSEWLAEVLDGIRLERGRMARVQNHCPPGAQVYKRSTSAADEVAGHSTVINALGEIGIDQLKPGWKSAFRLTGARP